MTVDLRVASYNILADAYVKPEWFPHTPAHLLRPRSRHALLACRILELDADIVCLQEVEPDSFAALQEALTPRGYTGVMAQKQQGRPDGCAVFHRLERSTGHRVHHFSDRLEDGRISGHLALVVDFDIGGERLRVACTHLRWDRPDRPVEQHQGMQQATELIHELIRKDPNASWVVCGDFNARPGEPLVRAFEAAGLLDAYAGQHQPTCNANGEPKAIDFLFHSSALRALPDRLTTLDARTPMPSEQEPSDHLPIAARLMR
ncbi:endonuclease/exonuclease/phosphatase family protein [Corallococcus macrosporus]|uniref:Endonuclease/exonuclease/phosphatase family protein n=1 Tax=Corallococcus macrosporus TaxID=35 RepID=A0ABS3DN83_9BACT|nr:endonuclease/exonuclease/phosphatase family protein [Corallococcus macrosporus]MBN8232733.1 endonuclease/exonuclease/phosphatase family protein [Corallococcus macrosporus]